MTRKTKNSLAAWEEYGRHVLMAMPYADQLISDGSGALLRDLDGNEILDFSAGQFCCIAGHGHPRFVENLTSQLRQVSHLGTQFLSPIVLEASAKLAEVAPGALSKCLFLSTGTEANECAISMAKTCTGKDGVVGFDRGYFGLSLATKSLSSIFSAGDGHGSGPTVPESFRLLAPHCFHCPVKSHYPECDFVCLESSTATLPRQSDVAAIIVEPIFSAGGMIVPPPGYLKKLKDFAGKIGALLIIDEAQTGFGRTGKWFACEHHEVEPDILVVSKSAGGGFPVSAVITTDQVADKLLHRKWLHLASHQSDPLSTAAVATTIDIVREENLVQKAEVDGRYLMDRLVQLKTKYPLIVDIRGQGLMIGLEIGNTPGGSDFEFCMGVVATCESQGLHLTYTYFEPVIRVMPPLTVTRDEIEKAVTILDSALSAASSGELELAELLPSNPYSRGLVQRLLPRLTLTRIASRLYETSPKSWLQSLATVFRK